MKMLKTKHFRRIVVFLAMLAPVVYLFGSLFSYLGGAHGSVDGVYAIDNHYQAKVIQEFDVSLYDDLNFSGTIAGGVTDLSVGEYPYDFVVDHYYFYNVSLVIDSDDFRVRLRSPILTVGAYPVDGVLTFSGYSFGISYDSYRYRFYMQLLGVSGEPFDVNLSVVSLQVVDLNVAFPDLTSTSDLQNAYESYLSGREYAKGVTYQDYSITTQGTAIDYLANKMFADDNLLVQVGRDVLSDNPHGFAPFAAFWKYLDTNMLHMGHMQLGLMGYGYVYYCCHVLLFDIAFILVTFFLDFIQKVNDKVVGGVD